MSDDPTVLPPAAKAEPELPEDARVILPKGYRLTINGKEFSLAMNTVLEGKRVDIVAAGLIPAK